MTKSVDATIYCNILRRDLLSVEDYMGDELHNFVVDQYTNPAERQNLFN